MGKAFYQCDVAESGSDNNIWTSAAFYVESEEEAEFLAMLSLQEDWGDSYLPDSFLEAFGRSKDDNFEDVERDDPEFPGVDAWIEGEYWRDWELMSDISIGMLPVKPVEALAQMGKIADSLTDGDVEAIMDGRATAEVRAFAA